MSSKRLVAVVTGANRGIGFCIVKALCKKFDGDVILTARDESKGKAAVGELNKLQLQPKFHQLDVTDRDSIRRLRNYLSDNYGGLDVLVNNAAMAKNESLKEWVETIARTNFFGVLHTCDELFPLLRPHARVVNLSSFLAMVKFVQSKELREKLADPNIGREDIARTVEQYVKDYIHGAWDHAEWAPHPYVVSKAATVALTFAQQREFDRDPREDLIVNAVHPGYVKTEMSMGSHFKAEMLTPEQGAKIPASLALLPRHVKSPRGEYMWYNGDIVDWRSETPPSVFIYQKDPDAA